MSGSVSSAMSGSGATDAPGAEAEPSVGGDAVGEAVGRSSAHGNVGSVLIMLFSHCSNARKSKRVRLMSERRMPMIVPRDARAIGRGHGHSRLIVALDFSRGI